LTNYQQNKTIKNCYQHKDVVKTPNLCKTRANVNLTLPILKTVEMLTDFFEDSKPFLQSKYSTEAYQLYVRKVSGTFVCIICVILLTKLTWKQWKNRETLFFAVCQL